ncbi:MAG: sigma-70 family RNA polymerase sigma factor [bacterium]|nr:sigma-70 family RNA polymerase sigma factor [bacterium]
MGSAILERAVEPLTRTTASGESLRRPVRIEAEIAAALDLDPRRIMACARAEPGTEDHMSEECIVHLIRRDLRGGSRQLAERLLPVLLTRCEVGLRRTVRGFDPAPAAEVREEVLGRLAVSLAEPGDAADFFEVRFALALKRLRIDVCRRQRRHEERLVALDEDDDSESAVSELDRRLPVAADQEDMVLLRQALATLSEEERKVLVLHRLAGVPMSSSAPRAATLVNLLGRSERTVRNRLRSAEAKLQTFGKKTGREEGT